MKLRMLVSALVATLAWGAPVATAQHHMPDGVVDLPVTFKVRNVNRSLVPCFADGSRVTLAGRIVGPRSLLTSPSSAAAVTLYLHEFSFGKWFWHFPVPAYDYAAIEAQAGHVSVVIDRLGYGDSSHPNGYATCVGADADEAHQIVQQLRAGSYQLTGAKPPAFRRVVLAGHSGGAFASEMEAYSFGGIDGLMILAHADQDPGALGTQEEAAQSLVCATGGQPSEPGGPGGYAYFGQTASDWRRDYFVDAEPRIVDAAVPLRHRDPCGDVGTILQGAVVNHLMDSRIHVPVLLLYGLGDRLYDQPRAGLDQRRLYTGSPDVTLAFFAGAGHALLLQRSAPAVRARVSTWLDAHNLT
jgi:alpha-beta hydrolase superfamily lysophospholipase